MENIFTADIAAAPKSLRRIPEGENFKRRDEFIGDNKVRVTYAVRAEKDAPRYEKQTTFDFTGVAPEQLMLLCCTNGVVVWVQRMLRDLGDGMLDPSAYAEVNVLSEIIEGERAVVDPLTRAKRAAQRLSPEQLQALLEELTGAQ